MSDVARENLIGLRLSDVELARLDEIADEHGLSRTNTLRMVLRQAYNAYERKCEKHVKPVTKRRANP